MKKFLIINPFGIGDVLFTSPVIRAIKKSLPESSVSYWCNERVKELFEGNPKIDKVIALSRGDLKRVYQESFLEGLRRFLCLLKDLKKEKFDIALDFSLDHRYSLILILLGIKQRIGFDYKKRGRFLTKRIDIDGYSGRHIVQRYLQLLTLLGIRTQDGNLELFVAAKFMDRAKNILSSAGIKENDILVAISCGAGASWGKEASLKHWPPLRFAQLADRIIENQNAKVILLGEPGERAIADIVLAAMRNKPIDLVGRTSLGELAAVIKRVNLLVCNDGGPLHMSVALGKRTVSIFGPVDENVYGPYPPSPEHIVIKNNIPCRPCYRQFRMPFCEHDRLCLKSVSVDEVYEAARRLLE